MSGDCCCQKHATTSRDTWHWTFLFWIITWHDCRGESARPRAMQHRMMTNYVNKSRVLQCFLKIKLRKNHGKCGWHCPETVSHAAVYSGPVCVQWTEGLSDVDTNKQTNKWHGLLWVKTNSFSRARNFVTWTSALSHDEVSATTAKCVQFEDNGQRSDPVWLSCICSWNVKNYIQNS